MAAAGYLLQQERCVEEEEQGVGVRRGGGSGSGCVYELGAEEGLGYVRACKMHNAYGGA
jgi:hypothetical protein